MTRGKLHRRLLLSALACCVATGVLAQEQAARPHRKISANALRTALMARFPVDLALPGLFEVRVDAGRLILLPARQRLGATLLAKVTELSSRHVYAFDMDLTFAVRYEAADQTLRAHQLEILGLRSPDLPPEAARTWQALLDGVVRSAVDEVVLHRFSRDELQVPDLLGVQPQKITVESDGVEIWFEPKLRQ